MKDDPFGVRGGMTALDTWKAAGLAPLQDYLDQSNRIAKQQEEFLASLSEPYREQERRLRDLTRGFIGDLSSHIALRDDIAELTRTAPAYGTVQSAAANQTLGLRAVDWLNDFNRTATVAGLSALGTLSSQALNGLWRGDAGLLAAMETAAGQTHARNALEQFSVHQTAADLFGSDLSAMDAAVRDVNEQLRSRFADGGLFRSTDDMRSAIAGLDAAGLRSAMEQFTEAAERWASEQDEREKREVSRFRTMVMLTVLFGLAATILSALQVYLAYEQQQKLPNSAPRAAVRESSPKQRAPHARPAVAVRTNHVALRLGPQTTQSVLVVLGKGQILPVMGRKAGWILVKYVPSAGKGASIMGWVQDRYTSRLDVETVGALLCALLDDSDEEPSSRCNESE